MRFHYATSLYVAFDDLDEGSSSDDFMEFGIENLLGNANDIQGTRKK